MISGRGRSPTGGRGTGEKKAPSPEAIEAGKRLKELRIKQGEILGITPPTRKAVALALGIDPGYMQLAENGWRPISRKRAPEIAAKFGVSPAFLLYGMSNQDAPSDHDRRLSMDKQNAKSIETLRGKVRLQNKTPSNRVEFDLPPRSMDRLNALKLKTEASSFAEVVRNALRVYEALIEETEDGKQFLVQDESGTISPYRLFL